MKNLWVLFVDNLCEKGVLLLSWIYLYANLLRMSSCARLEETLDTSRINHELLLRTIRSRRRFVYALHADGTPF